ncbi:sugar ABC transporter ATP-binding protein [Kaistia dalseonensis]|uniref:Erythritol transport system ATP-binding protein n=1 Tax=Kaistia dalseonensis TaxID=410840 RepID=A0ABU0HDP8_9HYPH|nr:sugar ABC transporter ATP-binding protein [Kaistia dalseonensis]MCX5497802.1 sugar ABC transporter ATP-binding protein [Kaistia dalseonensis]MDQ0440446.1 erythritol transport system ATP-binding protein [Kaistia dalseonensis]
MTVPDSVAPILSAEKISKIFPGTTALADVDFHVYPNAVNVLIGENGAGKSTLMKILSGVERPTSGRIVMEGREVTFASVRDAASKGIGIVFQELNLCPNLSIAENIFLGHPLTRGGFHLDLARQRSRARALLQRLEHDLDPDTKVGDLRIGQQQIVEIAKALSEDVRILIMDEPTSALSVSEVEVLFRVIDELKRSGVAIVYISHRLEELVRIGDFVTVLRDGRLQASARMDEIDVSWIIRQMLGTSELAARRPVQARAGREILRIEDVCLPRIGGGMTVDHVSLSIHAGEIVGIYGLLGAGRSELFECLFGARPDASGTIVLDGLDISGLSINQRIAKGLFLTPEDRQRDGLVQNLSVGRNMSLSSLGRFTRFGRITTAREGDEVARISRELQVKAPSPHTMITSLSGGNQQKVVIGKSLMTSPKVLLLDEPSRGIDIGAKAEIFRVMRELAEQGLGIIFATSDLKEVAIADRILVMSSGRITLDASSNDATDELLVSASVVGHTAHANNASTSKGSHHG